MRKLLIPCAVLLFAFAGLGFLLSQQNQEEAKFQKTMDTYFDDYWKFYPTAATLAGYYKYNDKLEDFSGKNLEKRADELSRLSQELVAKIDKTKLGREFMIDYEIIIDSMDLEVMRHENLLPWDYNPVYYNEIFCQSIEGLLARDFAPLDERLKSATQRAKQLPSFIKQAKETLKTPPQVFTETAILEFPGVLDFYRNEVPGFIEPASPEVKAAFQSEIAKVLAALEDYQGFLQSQLLPKSTGNFRLGEQAHLRLLRLTSENSIPFDELIARAKADFNNIRREMFLVCIPFFKIMYPNINLDQLGTQRSQDEVWDTAIQGVLDKIKVEHATKEGFVDQARKDADFVKNFLTETGLVPLPDVGLAVEPMPLVEQGVTLTRLAAPGVYESGGAYIDLVSPIPANLSAEQAQSLLEEYNDFYTYFWATRNIFPGTFAPVYFTRKYPSLPAKVFPNIPLLKGWPLYVENMLSTAGFGNYDLRLRLNQLKSMLKIVIDFQLEINVHQGGMTKEQAITYMTRRGYQTQAEAERKWNKIILKPGDTAYPYLGIQEIWDMEKDYKRLKGDAFTQKEFLQKILSYGAIPIRRLKELMAQ